MNDEDALVDVVDPWADAAKLVFTEEAPPAPLTREFPVWLKQFAEGPWRFGGPRKPDGTGVKVPQSQYPDFDAWIDTAQPNEAGVVGYIVQDRSETGGYVLLDNTGLYISAQNGTEAVLQRPTRWGVPRRVLSTVVDGRVLTEPIKTPEDYLAIGNYYRSWSVEGSHGMDVHRYVTGSFPAEYAPEMLEIEAQRLRFERMIGDPEVEVAACIPWNVVYSVGESEVPYGTSPADFTTFLTGGRRYVVFAGKAYIVDLVYRKRYWVGPVCETEDGKHVASFWCMREGPGAAQSSMYVHQQLNHTIETWALGAGLDKVPAKSAKYERYAAVRAATPLTNDEKHFGSRLLRALDYPRGDLKLLCQRFQAFSAKAVTVAGADMWAWGDLLRRHNLAVVHSLVSGEGDGEQMVIGALYGHFACKQTKASKKCTIGPLLEFRADVRAGNFPRISFLRALPFGELLFDAFDWTYYNYGFVPMEWLPAVCQVPETKQVWRSMLRQMSLDEAQAFRAEHGLWHLGLNEQKPLEALDLRQLEPDVDRLAAYR